MDSNKMDSSAANGQMKLKVLFVASGNKYGRQVSSFVQSQYESLQTEGFNMLMCPVSGHGWKAYAKTVLKLRRMIRKEQPDIIHAHYTTCGIVAWLACIGLCHHPKILVSILGSFPSHSFKWRYVRCFVRRVWDGTLTKSKRTADQLGFELPIVPNGVNINIFHPVSKSEREVLRLRLFGEKENNQSQITNHQSQITNHKYIIWCSNPARPEKNWALAERAVEIIRESDREKSQITNLQSQIELFAVYNKTPQEVAEYMNAADCMLLTSMSEGSPNVIKEAMACNCPIVTTDVGDVEERLSAISSNQSQITNPKSPITNHQSQIINNKYLPGCYVIPADATPTYGLQGVGEWFERDAQYLAEALRKALDFGKRTEGYERILQDGLTVELTAKKIIKIYESL